MEIKRDYYLNKTICRKHTMNVYDFPLKANSLEY